MNPRRLSSLLPPLFAGILAGCVVGPTYEAPAPADPGSWTVSDLDGTPPPAAWWRRFEDPALDGLIERALADNLDIAIAGERIVQAREAAIAAGARAHPSVDATASVARQRQSETGPLPVGRIPGLPVYQTIYDAGFDARWELDLFGRTRRAVEAAEAGTDAAIARRRAVAVSVIAEVARAYFAFRGAQAELAAAEASVTDASRTVGLVAKRVDAGGAPRDTLRRAEADLALERTRLAPVRARRDAALLALGFLTGTTPEAHLDLIEASRALPPLEPVPVGTRGELLRRRPDVLAAERNLAAATAGVGMAEGALYPRVGLSAGGGFNTLESSDLLDAASRRWTIAPLISWNVLDSGRLHAEIRSAESRQREAALGYERAVLGALTEAEQAIRAYGHALDALTTQQAALAAVRAGDEAVARRFEAGAVSLLDRLDSQRRRFEAAAALARSHARAADALVAVYKALGGGWEELPAAP